MSSWRIPAGFSEGGGGRLQPCLVLHSLPPSLKSADQHSHASLPGVGDYSHESICVIYTLASFGIYVVSVGY